MNKRLYAIACCAMAFVVAALSLLGAWNDSATADEPAHIASAIVKVTQGRRAFFVEQAPLINTLTGIPLAIAGYRAPANLTNRQWRAGAQLLFRAGYDAQRMLFLARIPTIALLIALCFAVSLYVLHVTANSGAALIAFALTAFCPNLLAHGRLATVDLGVSLFLFLAAIAFLQLLRAPSMRIAIVCGLATTAAILSKTSATLIVFFFLAVAILRYKDALRARRELAIAGGVALASFLVFYMLLLRSFDVSIGVQEYLNAIQGVHAFYASAYGMPQFLLGAFNATGWRHYYAVAFLLKTTIPALLLIIVTLVSAAKQRRFETLALLGFVLLFAGAASFSRLNIGIRHILPVYPFLYAATGITIANATRKLLVPALVAACHVVIALAAFPSYLSYFNACIGNAPPDAFLIDSNVDWGQDLHRLAMWSGNERVRLHYFGGSDVTYELGSRVEVWKAPRPEPLPKGLFAVSKHIYRISFAPGFRENYEHYLARSHAKYVTTVGGSIDVYRVE